MGGPVIVYDFTGGSDDTHTWVEWPDDHGSELAHSFGSPLGHNWPKPITIRARNPEDPILPLSDCPHHTSSDVIVLSRRAVDALHDLLAPAAEILPLRSDLGEFYAINVLRKIDCLDHERSDLLKSSSTGRIFMISRPVFVPERIGDALIFRVPEHRAFILVTQPFVDRVRQARLVGFGLREVWRSADEPPRPPAPPGKRRA